MSRSEQAIQQLFASILAAVLFAGSSATLSASEIEPSLPAVQTVSDLPNVDLAFSFLAAGEMLSTGIGVIHEALKMQKEEGQLIQFPNVSSFAHMPDGSTQEHKFKNYEELDQFIQKIRVFHTKSKEEIFKRGFSKVEGAYDASVSPACPSDWLSSGRVDAQRIEFYFFLTQGEKGFEGAVVGDAAVVIFPSGFQPPLIGTVRPEQISLRSAQGNCEMVLKQR